MGNSHIGWISGAGKTKRTTTSTRHIQPIGLRIVSGSESEELSKYLAIAMEYLLLAQQDVKSFAGWKEVRVPLLQEITFNPQNGQNLTFP